MALTNQPYLPLYVNDYLMDQELNECSPATQGVYIKIMCVLHKSKTYGRFLLKQKYKQSHEQNFSKIVAFAPRFGDKLIRLSWNLAESISPHINFPKEVLFLAICELIDEKVLFMDGDYLCQKRMMKDYQTSVNRAKNGRKGGINSRKNLLEKIGNNGYTSSTEFASDFAQANSKQNTENEYAYISNTLNDKKEKEVIEKPKKNSEPKNLNKWNTRPDENTVFEDLSQVQVQGCIEMVKFVKGKMLLADDVQAMWKIFIKTYCTGKKFYQEKSDVFSHFQNWIKTQPFQQDSKTFKDPKEVDKHVKIRL